ncbi:MAG: hypothetical protein RSE93_01575, partial [Oscillospiraceae bacterium]
MPKIIRCDFSSQDNTDFSYKLKDKPTIDIEQELSGNEIEDKNILKARNSAKEAYDKIISDAKEEAKRILEDAKRKSLDYIKEKKEAMDAEIENSKKMGYNQGMTKGIEEGRDKGIKIGYEKGFEDGNNEATKIYTHNVQFMQSVIESIDDAKHDMLKKNEAALSDVAYAMAKMIIKKEVEKDASFLKKIILLAAQECKNQEYITVTLSKFGYDMMTNSDDEVVSRLKLFSDDIRFFIDDSFD